MSCKSATTPLFTKYVLTTVLSFQMRCVMYEVLSWGALEISGVKNLLDTIGLFIQYFTWKLSIVVKAYFVGQGVVAPLYNNTGLKSTYFTPCSRGLLHQYFSKYYRKMSLKILTYSRGVDYYLCFPLIGHNVQGSMLFKEIWYLCNYTCLCKLMFLFSEEN